jgi:hypothetical protein
MLVRDYCFTILPAHLVMSDSLDDRLGDVRRVLCALVSTRVFEGSLRRCAPDLKMALPLHRGVRLP